MSKHTPGPWHVHEGTTLYMGDCILGAQVWGGRDRIAFTEQQNVGSVVEAANAALIASAPTLLAVCKALVETYWANKGEIFGADIALVEAAIAKAEGTTP
jgi:hypothetical protein